MPIVVNTRTYTYASRIHVQVDLLVQVARVSWGGVLRNAAGNISVSFLEQVSLC